MVASNHRDEETIQAPGSSTLRSDEQTAACKFRELELRQLYYYKLPTLP